MFLKQNLVKFVKSYRPLVVNSPLGSLDCFNRLELSAQPESAEKHLHCALPPMTTIQEQREYLVSIPACIKAIYDHRAESETAAWYREDYHWKVRNKAILMRKYTVKDGSRLLSIDGQIERADAYYRWIYVLCGATVSPNRPIIPHHLWRIHMDNKWKEPFWHATMDGFLHSRSSKQCDPIKHF